MRVPAVNALGAQRFPALGAACVQDLSASLGGHARTKAVAPFADQVRRLKCAFHRASPCVSHKSRWIRRLVNTETGL